MGMKKKIKNIFIAGLPPMTESECAVLMVQEARAIMKRDLGLTESAWSLSQVSQTAVVSNNNSIMKSKDESSQPSKSEVDQNVERMTTTIIATPVNKKQKCDTSITKTQPIVVSPKPVRENTSEIIDKTVECDPKDSSMVTGRKRSKRSSERSCDKTTDLFDISGMSDTFDMSSVVENIFNDEAEIIDSKRQEVTTKKKKKVSWGDDDQKGFLCVEKEITPCNSQTIPEVLATPLQVNKTIDYQPKTPKFKVCSEELDLHWSGSDSDSDCVIEDSGEKVKEANDDDVINDSNDVFGDTISDSVLVRAMDQDQQLNKQMEMSTGMMMAAEGLDSQITFTDHDIGVSDTSVATVASVKRKKRKRRRQLTSASVNVSSQILLDSDTDPETPGQNSEQNSELTGEAAENDLV